MHLIPLGSCPANKPSRATNRECLSGPLGTTSRIALITIALGAVFHDNMIIFIRLESAAFHRSRRKSYHHLVVLMTLIVFEYVTS